MECSDQRIRKTKTMGVHTLERKHGREEEEMMSLINGVVMEGAKIM